jgi:hypothetical protein
MAHPARSLALGAMAVALCAAGRPGRAQPAAPTAPQPRTSTQAEAAEGFYLGVARCLYSREHGGGVADLPPEAKADLRPALPAERFMFKDEATKVWTTDLYGAHVVIAEPSPGKCQVVADQLPVDATFRRGLARLHSADAALREEPVQPGYWPIVDQLERMVETTRYTVRLQGAEPGGLAHPMQMLAGHASPCSLLIAQVERSPDAPQP